MDRELKISGLIASAKNLIGVIENKQWERLDKKALSLKEAITIVEESKPLDYKQGTICDHNFVSSVAYKGAKICSKCQLIK